MNEIIALVKDLLQEFPALRALAASMGWAVVMCSGFFVFFYLIETRLGRDTARYRSQNFLNDVAYTVLYQGGIYNILLYAPVFALISPHLGFIALRIDGRAAVCRGPGHLVGVHGLHRLLDAPRATHIPILWAFHSVHHTQTKMTFLTSNRIHLLEQFYVNLIMFTPAALLGLPVERWLPFYFAVDVPRARAACASAVAVRLGASPGRKPRVSRHASLHRAGAVHGQLLENAAGLGSGFRHVR